MAVLWRTGTPISGRDVHKRLRYPRPVAYTTVMTVLDRLEKKGVVERQRDGRAWLYSTDKTCVDLHVDEIISMLAGCGHGHADETLDAVRARLDEVAVDGVSCQTSGDPDWNPGRTCMFLPACSAQGNSCSDCQVRSRSRAS